MIHPLQWFLAATMLIGSVTATGQMPPGGSSTSEFKPSPGSWRVDTIPLTAKPYFASGDGQEFTIVRSRMVVYDEGKLLMEATDSTITVYGDTLSVLKSILRAYGVDVRLTVKPKPHPLTSSILTCAVLKCDYCSKIVATEQLDKEQAANEFEGDGYTRLKDGTITCGCKK